MANRRQLIDAVEVTDTGIHLVRLKQIFDATSVNEFEKVLAYLLAKEQYRLVVDLTHVEFIASAGWGAFTAEFRNVRKAGGDIRLAGMNPDVQDVFFLLELDSFIKAFETVDEAIFSFEEEMGAAAAQAGARRKEEAAADNEAAAEEDYVEADDGAEAEPAGYEIAEVYEPEYRAPLALSTDNASAPQPEHQRPAPSVEEDEGWVVAEEIEPAENADAAAYESFNELASEITFEEVSEAVAEEPSDAAVFEEEPEARAWSEAPSAPPVAARAANLAHARGEEWPEARAEENLASDDFELQDIHDPWILEEIDTLPEEDELEEADWSASEEDEIPSAPVKKDPTSTPAKPAARAATMPATSPKEITPAMPAALQEQRESPKRATLADKIKAAQQTPTPQEQSDASLALVEQENLNLVRQIVSAHPEFGPAMIQKFCETAHEPPMQVSRSTVYRWLRLAGLNTREQRFAFAEESNADNEFSKTSTSA